MCVSDSANTSDDGPGDSGDMPDTTLDMDMEVPTDDGSPTDDGMMPSDDGQPTDDSNPTDDGTSTEDMPVDMPTDDGMSAEDMEDMRMPCPSTALFRDGADCVTDIEQLTTGAAHACVLTDTGSVWCWGNNLSGQLGVPVAMMQSSATPQKVSGLTMSPTESISDLDAGANHTCVVIEDANTTSAEIACWGQNTFDQLGATTPNNTSPTPIRISSPGLSGGPLTVSAGVEHTCAAIVDGQDAMKCWGSDADGQLLLPGGASCAGGNCTSPQATETRKYIADVEAGPDVTCFIELATSLMDTNLELYCYGAPTASSNKHIGSTFGLNNATVPTAIALGQDFGCVNFRPSDGRDVTDALTSGGQVQCFGVPGTPVGRTQPQDAYVKINDPVLEGVGEEDFVPLRDVVLHDVGDSHACAVTDADKVWCWGDNTERQSGAINASDNMAKKLPYTAQGPIEDIALGAAFSCILEDGDVLCWGDDGFDQLGRAAGSMTPNDTPEAIAWP